MDELWKDIAGFEGRYQISTFGNVLSLNYRNRGKAGLVTPKCNNAGRLWVILYGENGRRVNCLIHRLVAQAFIPNPDNLPQINHKDENPKNNHVENLEWCDCLYNVRYSMDRHPERCKNYNGPNTVGKRKIGKCSALKVNQYDEDGNYIRTWENSRTAYLEIGIRDWHISECCRGHRKTAGGFIWRYAS